MGSKIKRQYVRCYGILCALLVIGCAQKSFDSEQEILEFIKDEDYGYAQTKTVNGIEFSLLYKPTDLLVHQELKGAELNPSKIKALRNRYSQFLYFNLSMSKGKKELLSAVPKNQEEFGAFVNQLAFGMGDKVHLFTAEKDTLDLIDFVYPRMYGMSNATTLMFIYPRDNKALESETLYLSVEDIGMSTGEVKFKIPCKLINQEPQLSF